MKPSKILFNQCKTDLKMIDENDENFKEEMGNIIIKLNKAFDMKQFEDEQDLVATLEEQDEPDMPPFESFYPPKIYDDVE